VLQPVMHKLWLLRGRIVNPARQIEKWCSEVDFAMTSVQGTSIIYMVRSGRCLSRKTAYPRRLNIARHKSDCIGSAGMTMTCRWACGGRTSPRAYRRRWLSFDVSLQVDITCPSHIDRLPTRTHTHTHAHPTTTTCPSASENSSVPA
jgi:hypothetical protein